MTSGTSGEEGLRPLRTDKSLQINNRISDDTAKILHKNRLRGAMDGSLPIELKKRSYRPVPTQKVRPKSNDWKVGFLWQNIVLNSRKKLF